MTTPAPLALRLLGVIEVRVAGQPVPLRDAARVESLLAFLALHRDAPQPRELVASSSSRAPSCRASRRSGRPTSRPRAGTSNSRCAATGAST